MAKFEIDSLSFHNNALYNIHLPEVDETVSETDDSYDEAASTSSLSSSPVLRRFPSCLDRTSVVNAGSAASPLIPTSPLPSSVSSFLVTDTSQMMSTESCTSTVLPSHGLSFAFSLPDEESRDNEEDSSLKEFTADMNLDPGFSADALNLLDPGHQAQLHDTIFDFLYILNTLGGGEGYLSLLQDQRLQVYVNLLSELKQKLITLITIHVEDPQVVEPLLQLNDAVEEALGLYRSRRPLLLSEHEHSSSNRALSASESTTTTTTTTTSASRQGTDARNSLTVEGEETCNICYMEIPLKDFVTLGCGDSLCRNCAVAYYRLGIEQGRVTLTCPVGSGCSAIATEDDIMNIVPSLIDKYREFCYFAKVRRDPNARWCPKPGCNTVAFGSADEPKLTCSTCSTHFCFLCTQEWHEGLTCKENGKQLAKKGIIDTKSEKWKRKHKTKPCPVCGASIEKNHGCNHMTCTACRHEFCWVCMATFTWDHFTTGKCQQFSFSHRLKNDAADLGALGLVGLWYVIVGGITIPVVAAGAPLYGVYKLGKKVFK